MTKKMFLYPNTILGQTFVLAWPIEDPALLLDWGIGSYIILLQKSLLLGFDNWL